MIRFDYPKNLSAYETIYPKAVRQLPTQDGGCHQDR